MMRRLFLVFSLPALACLAQQASTPQRDPFPGYVTTPSASSSFPGYAPSPPGSTPLSKQPQVLGLEYRTPQQMTAGDVSVVSSLSSELAEKAAFYNFDLSDSGWRYQQVVCPAFPDYVVLDFQHGPDPNGSSRFVAVLERDGPGVRIISRFAHGALSFQSSWEKPATYRIFNRMLRRERGAAPLGNAPNWLMIGICYAELSGYHVQLLTSTQQPDETLDMSRLNGNQPQLLILPNGGAEISFSDVSRPAYTTSWTLRFDAHGQIVAASHSGEQQPARIALQAH